MYHEKFGQLVTSLKNLTARVPEVQIKELRRLASVIERQGKEVKPTYRAYFIKAANLMTSLADGLASGDVSRGDYLQIIEEMDGYANAVEEIEKAPVQDRKTALPDDFLTEMQKDTDKAIKKYAAFKQMVPERPDKKLTVKLLPVVAITDPFMRPEKLEALKMTKDYIFGYPVLEGQVVAGIKNDWLAESYRNNFAEAMQDVLDMVRHKTGKEYVQLGEPTRRSNATWVWLVNSTMLNKLHKASASGAFKLKAWAFPFEPKAFQPKSNEFKTRVKEMENKLWDPKKNPFVSPQGRTL